MRNAQSLSKKFLVTLLIAALPALSGALAPADAAENELSLAGSITSPAGEKMGGVTVSAKAEGLTITTSVFTDDTGNFYFPSMPPGKYRVWAQALSFETAAKEVALPSTPRQDFVLKPINDLERQIRQLPGDLLIAALSEETPDDLRMKRLVRNNCTGCHTPSYVLQHRFDEAGWTAIIELMKRVNVGGIFQGEDKAPNPILDINQKELAAYLTRARGPGESAMKIKLRPRPSGEAARRVPARSCTMHGPARTAIFGTRSAVSIAVPPSVGSTPRPARPRNSSCRQRMVWRRPPTAWCSITTASCGLM
jgi:hypothetical protein